MYKNSVKFKGIGQPVKVSNRQIGEGSTRVAYNCDYTKDGRNYVVKHGYKERGAMTNRFEFHIYAHAKHTRFKKFYPDFRAISKDGSWLLLEKCKPAEQFNKLYVHAYDIFPKFMHNDLFGCNWGYTLKDKRPVMFDLGYNYDGLSKSAREVGMSNDEIEMLADHFIRS